MNPLNLGLKVDHVIELYHLGTGVPALHHVSLIPRHKEQVIWTKNNVSILLHYLSFTMGRSLFSFVVCDSLRSILVE